jgi:hypothetical protein
MIFHCSAWFPANVPLVDACGAGYSPQVKSAYGPLSHLARRNDSVAIGGQADIARTFEIGRS